MVLFGVVLVVFMLWMGHVAIYRVTESPSLFLTANALAFLTAIPYALLLLWIDRNEKEPFYLIGAALLWGALVATCISGEINVGYKTWIRDILLDPYISRRLSMTLSAPFIEELTKGVAVMAIFVLFKDEFDNILDGILYGALVGLGFATIENVDYYMDIGEVRGPEGMLELTWIRGVLGGLSGHATYTALTGCGFAMVRMARKGLARWLYVPAYWFLAVLLHFMWNKFHGEFSFSGAPLLALAVSAPLAVLVLNAPFTTLLLITIRTVWKQENQVILTYLMDEREDIVTREQCQALVPARSRIQAGLRRLFKRGPRLWWHQRKLEYELAELAFAKWHLDEDPKADWAADDDQDIERLRAVVRRRRRRLDDLSQSSATVNE